MAKKSTKAAPKKKGAASSKKTPSRGPTIAGPKAKNPKVVVASEQSPEVAELANMSAAIKKIRGEWGTKGQEWIKKFDLPKDNEVHAMSVLFAKINYGKVKLSELS